MDWKVDVEEPPVDLETEVTSDEVAGRIRKIRELMFENAPSVQVEATLTTLLDSVRSDHRLSKATLTVLLGLLEQSRGWARLCSSDGLLKAADRIRFRVRDQFRVQDLAADALLRRLDQLLLLPSPEALSDWSSSVERVVSHGLTSTLPYPPALDLFLGAAAALDYMRSRYEAQFLGYLIENSQKCRTIRDQCLRTLTNCVRLLLSSLPLPLSSQPLESRVQQLRRTYGFCRLDLTSSSAVSTGQVVSLKRACRLSVRKVFWENWALPDGIRRLDIPEELRTYLWLDCSIGHSEKP